MDSLRAWLEYPGSDEVTVWAAPKLDVRPNEGTPVLGSEGTRDTGDKVDTDGKVDTSGEVDTADCSASSATHSYRSPVPPTPRSSVSASRCLAGTYPYEIVAVFHSSRHFSFCSIMASKFY